MEEDDGAGVGGRGGEVDVAGWEEGEHVLYFVSWCGVDVFFFDIK